MKGRFTSGDCGYAMRLNRFTLEQLVGRTIIDHLRNFWQVTGIADDRQSLSVSRFNSTGKLLVSLLPRCRLHPNADDIQQRYPRLLTVLRHACLLTRSEAESAVIGLLVNGPFDYGSEAVARIGGSGQAIQHAVARRHLVWQQLRRIEP